MSATNRCPVCDSETAPDAAASTGCEEAVCANCAASYASLMAEITSIAPRACDAPAEIGVMLPAVAGDEVVASAAPGMAVCESTTTAPKAEEAVMIVEDFGNASPDAVGATEGAGNYAMGVSVHRVSASALVMVSACLFCVITLAGWYGLGDRGETSAIAGEKHPAAFDHGALWEPSEQESKTKQPAAAPAPEPEPPAAQQTVAEAQAEHAEQGDEHPAADEPSAEVEVGDVQEVATPAIAPEVAAAHASDGGRFTIQVGSYNLAPEADDRAASLRGAGFDARVSSAVLPGKGTWYRVHSGRFASREEALRYERQLKGSGAVASTFVTEIKN